MKRRAPHPRRRGTILLPALLFSVVLAGAAVAYSTTIGSTARHRGHELRELRERLASEAALSAALVELRAGRSGVLGSSEEPLDFGGLRYYTELRDLGGDRHSLLAVGVGSSGQRALEALLDTSTTEVASQAVFGLERVRLASNAAVDSYDPRLGDYASQAVRKGSVTFAGTNGNVASNGSLEVASNGYVFGDARWGPDADDTFASSGTVLGAATPLGRELELDVPEPPAGASAGSLTVAARAARSVGPGVVVLDDVRVEGKGALTLVGPAEVVLGSFELEPLASLLVDASAGPVTIFCQGDFRLRSNARVAVDAKDATEVTLVLLAKQETEDERDPPLAFDSNGTWIGRVLAPNALVDVSSNFEVFGAILARWVNLSSNTALHYDERLAEVDDGLAQEVWRVLGTRELSDAQVAGVRGGGDRP